VRRRFSLYIRFIILLVAMLKCTYVLAIILLLSQCYSPLFSQNIYTVAGGGIGDGGSARNAVLNRPTGVAVATDGNIYLVDRSNNVIRKVTPQGIISTIAGNGVSGNDGDGGSALNSSLGFPVRLVLDKYNNLYFSSTFSHVIKKVNLDTGIITTVAGNGTEGYSGDGAAAINAQLRFPWGVSIDGNGNLFIADKFNSVIRKVSPTGIITTIAGTGVPGYSGNGGLAINAQLSYPNSIACDEAGNLFIADRGGIRKINALNGIITSVAGVGDVPNTSGTIGDNGLAINASVVNPYDVTVDKFGNLFIADLDNNRIRRVDALTGIISTIAGNGSFGSAGDNGLANC
jgi:NHL repeat